MWKGIVPILISSAIALVGAGNTAYQIYKMTALDAKARGLKHPKFWGFFAMNGNNSSGLILYLLGRRSYPVINMSETDRLEIEVRKKKIGVGIIFLVLGGIGIIVSITMT